MKHESELARILDVAPPEAYERGADGRRAWWRRALELFGTFRRNHGDALTREDVAEFRKHKAREELPVTDPERHLGLRVSRLAARSRRPRPLRRSLWTSTRRISRRRW